MLEVAVSFPKECSEVKCLQLAMALLCLLVLDFLWLHVVNNKLQLDFYSGSFDRSQIVPYYGLIAWLSLSIGIASLRHTASAPEAAAWGALVALVGYGTFNGTEAAIRPRWRNAKIIAGDLLWGLSACTASSLVAQQVAKKAAATMC